MYENGCDCLPQDINRAAALYRCSAENGNKAAQRKLGMTGFKRRV